MPKSKREPIPKHFATSEEAGEFWDTHDLGDYWDQTEEVEMSFHLKRKRHLFAIEQRLAQALHEVAVAHGVSPETMANLWLREQYEARKTMSSLSEIVEKYKGYLLAKHPARHKPFSDLERSKPESARAEAVLFSVLEAEGFEVTICEDPSTGGIDFRCKKSEDAFLVEVTCLEKETVTERSGLEEGTDSGWSEPITLSLRNKIRNKARQLSGSPMPRLLAITTEHEAGGWLMGTHGAEALLTGDSKIEVPIGLSEPDVRLITDLWGSGFLQLSGSGTIEAYRQSISAILLVHILPSECKIAGVLHPRPAFDFPIQLLPTVPFVRVRRWPPDEGKIETEWTIVKPSPARFRYE